MTHTSKHLASLVDDLYFLEKRIRLEERDRAARIIREYEAYSPYIVESHKIENRKKEIIDEIINGVDDDYKAIRREI